MHHSCLPLPKQTLFCQYGQVENTRGHLFEKKFLVCFSPLFPQAEYREDAERFAKYFQVHVSRTFTKAKNFGTCAEYPKTTKIYLSNWKIYFYQFIDKYLKIEEMEYLIHYVKLKCDQSYFM